MDPQIMMMLFTTIGPKLITALEVLARDKGKSFAEITQDEIDALANHVTPGAPNASALSG